MEILDFCCRRHIGLSPLFLVFFAFNHCLDCALHQQFPPFFVIIFFYPSRKSLKIFFWRSFVHSRAVLWADDPCGGGQEARRNHRAGRCGDRHRALQRAQRLVLRIKTPQPASFSPAPGILRKVQMMASPNQSKWFAATPPGVGLGCSWSIFGQRKS